MIPILLIVSPPNSIYLGNPASSNNTTDSINLSAWSPLLAVHPFHSCWTSCVPPAPTMTVYHAFSLLPPPFPFLPLDSSVLFFYPISLFCYNNSNKTTIPSSPLIFHSVVPLAESHSSAHSPLRFLTFSLTPYLASHLLVRYLRIHIFSSSSPYFTRVLLGWVVQPLSLRHKDFAQFGPSIEDALKGAKYKVDCLLSFSFWSPIPSSIPLSCVLFLCLLFSYPHCLSLNPRPLHFEKSAGGHLPTFSTTTFDFSFFEVICLIGGEKEKEKARKDGLAFSHLRTSVEGCFIGTCCLDSP